MQALEEAQGSPDKLQSAPGVNLVREGLELFTAFKILQKFMSGGLDWFCSQCFAHKANTIYTQAV